MPQQRIDGERILMYQLREDLALFQQVFRVVLHVLNGNWLLHSWTQRLAVLPAVSRNAT